MSNAVISFGPEFLRVFQKSISNVDGQRWVRQKRTYIHTFLSDFHRQCKITNVCFWAANLWIWARAGARWTKSVQVSTTWLVFYRVGRTSKVQRRCRGVYSERAHKKRNGCCRCCCYCLITRLWLMTTDRNRQTHTHTHRRARTRTHVNWGQRRARVWDDDAMADET